MRMKQNYPIVLGKDERPLASKKHDLIEVREIVKRN